MTTSYNNRLKKYKAEAQKKWGETDAYKEYEEKTKNYSDKKENSFPKGLQNFIMLVTMMTRCYDAREML